MFIYPLATGSSLPLGVADTNQPDPAFLIEVDADQLSNLTRWLTKYKLRAKVKLRPVPADELAIYSFWDEARAVETLGEDLQASDNN